MSDFNWKSPKRLIVACAVLGGAGAAIFFVSRPSVDQATSPTAPTAQIAPSAESIATDGSAKHETASTAQDPATSVAPANSGSPQVATAPAVEAAKPSCFTKTFRHQPTTGHTDMDACGRHRNVIRFAAEHLNQKSICLRVDGTPVHFDLKNTKGQTELVFGAVAGPGSKVSVRFCQQGATCSEDCAVPKDEFMAAIGGEDEGTDAVKVAKVKGKGAKWDANDQAKDADVSEEIEAEIARELAGDDTLALYDGWKQDSEAAAASCGTSGTLVSKRQ